MKNKNRILLYAIMLLLVANAIAFAQEVTKTSASPISDSVCPNVGTFYEVSRPSGFGVCKITWSVTNGQITSANGLPTVTVKWNDSPGTKGEVTATFSNCGNSNDGVSVSLEELILSVKGQSFGSYDNSIDINYCLKSQVYITVPPMVVQGTGGIAQPPRTEVAYAWTLPPGWREVGTNRTGEFGTSTHDILIEPIDCAKKGIVKVEGALIGVGLCDAAGLSAPATISLNGTDPVVTVTPQPGYTGASACNTTPVTFYANSNAGCVSNYNWVLPSSWTEVSRSGSSITLRPTGTIADEANIKATINYSCGNEVSGIFKPSFKDPVISSPAAICYGGTQVSLSNAPSTGIMWTSSSNITILSGQGTPSILVRGVSSSTKEAGTINVSIRCANLNVPEKNVWVGLPRNVLISGPQLVAAGSYNNYSAAPWNNDPPFSTQGITSTGFEWTFPLTSTNAGWECYGCNIQTSYVKAGSSSTYVSVRTRNNCGPSPRRDYEVFVEKNCPPRGCDEPFFTYPNPADSKFTVSLIEVGSGRRSTEVTLQDAYGNNVYNIKTSERVIDIPVKDFNNGTYYVSILTANGKRAYQRILIDH